MSSVASALICFMLAGVALITDVTPSAAVRAVRSLVNRLVFDSIVVGLLLAMYTFRVVVCFEASTRSPSEPTTPVYSSSVSVPLPAVEDVPVLELEVEVEELAALSWRRAQIERGEDLSRRRLEGVMASSVMSSTLTSKSSASFCFTSSMVLSPPSMSILKDTPLDGVATATVSRIEGVSDWPAAAAIATSAL